MKYTKGIILFIFLLSSCASVTEKKLKTFPKSEINSQISQVIKVQEPNRDQVLNDIVRFRSIIQRGKPLSASEWKLHDSLLEIYIRLKYRPQNGMIQIPARTKLIIPLNSYCLDGHKAKPARNEVFQWRLNHRDLESPYFQEILKLSEQRKYSQSTLQELMWNLQNKTEWENYPQVQKDILMEIDPKVVSKIPSANDIKIKKFVIDEVSSQLPKQIQNSVEIIKGHYYTFEDFKEKIEALKSKEILPEGRVTLVDGTSVYVENESNGFLNQEVSFYNGSKESQTLDLTRYKQIPVRSDVQPLSAYYPDNLWSDIFKDLEKLLYGDMARMGLGFVPVFGDLIDLYEASTGKNFFTDEWLTPEERFLSATAVLVGSSESYRQANKILHGPKNYISETHKKYRQIRNTENYKRLEKLSEDVRSKGIPDDWRVKVSRAEKERQGLEFLHPENDHARIRVMPGNPKSPNRGSHKPYVVIRKDGKFLNRNGDLLQEEGIDTHIPFDEFDFKKIEKIFRK